MSHIFVIKIISRKKFLAPPQTHFRCNFSVSKSHCVYEITQYFFRYFKALLLIYHIANNLILAISFGFKLNSNLKTKIPSVFLDLIQKFIEHYNTRYSANHNLYKPSSRTNYGLSRFKVISSRIWEKIPLNIKQL